ncbi:ribosomal protein L1 [Aureobasidium subglaciale]|nr:ribosomal protein L1 [Aureobasidium subglaciale]
MASTRTCLSQLTQTTLSRPKLYVPSISIQQRGAVQSANAQKYKRKELPTSQRKKKSRTTFINHDLKDAIQFPLVDAMRYLRATEVGRVPTSSKYELHLRLKSLKNGPVVRNRIRLPHPVKTDLRIAVICDPNSAAATAAKKAGATLVGEEAIFDAVKEGRIEFDRCLCHQDSLAKMNKAALGRILGPRGLMPSAKTGTVVKDVAASVQDMVGASEYRERTGVIRMAIGQLGMTPEELSRNIRSFIENVKKDMAGMSDRISKDIHEVVISSTNGPGLSLNGDLRGPDSIPTKDLSTAIPSHVTDRSTIRLVNAALILSLKSRSTLDESVGTPLASRPIVSSSSHHQMDDLTTHSATTRVQGRKRGGEDRPKPEAAGFYPGAKRIKIEDKEPSAPPTTPSAPNQRSQTISVTPQVVAKIDALPLTPKQKTFLVKKIDNANKAACALPFWGKENPYIADPESPTNLRAIGDRLDSDFYSSVDHFMEDIKFMMETKLSISTSDPDDRLQVKKFKEYFYKQMLKCPKRDTSQPEPAAPHQSPAVQEPQSVYDGSPLTRRDATTRPKLTLISSAQDTAELKFCKHILEEFSKPEHDDFTRHFRIPVAEDVLNYHSMIEFPMDISTIRNKLERGEYDMASEFKDDFELMFKNCFFFNPPTNEVHQTGKKFSWTFNNQWSKMGTWIEEHATEAPAPSRRILARRGGSGMYGSRPIPVRGARGRCSASGNNKTSESEITRPSFAPPEEVPEPVQPAHESATSEQQMAVSSGTTTTPSLDPVQPARVSVVPEQQNVVPAEITATSIVEAVQPPESTPRQSTARSPIIEDPDVQEARLQKEISDKEAVLAKDKAQLAAVQKRKALQALQEERIALEFEREPLDKEIVVRRSEFKTVMEGLDEVEQKLRALEAEKQRLTAVSSDMKTQATPAYTRVRQINLRHEAIGKELEALDYENIA